MYLIDPQMADRHHKRFCSTMSVEEARIEEERGGDIIHSDYIDSLRDNFRARIRAIDLRCQC